MSDKKINPQIRTVNIGIKELRPIKIYPLSMSDQMKMADLVKGTFQALIEYTQTDDASDIAIAETFISLMKENLPLLLKYITDEEVSLEELTNFQFTEIVGHVYKDNFEDASKNVKSLVEKLGKMFKSTRSLQQ